MTSPPHWRTCTRAGSSTATSNRTTCAASPWAGCACARSRAGSHFSFTARRPPGAPRRQRTRRPCRLQCGRVGGGDHVGHRDASPPDGRLFSSSSSWARSPTWRRAAALRARRASYARPCDVYSFGKRRVLALTVHVRVSDPTPDPHAGITLNELITQTVPYSDAICRAGTSRTILDALATLEPARLTLALALNAAQVQLHTILEARYNHEALTVAIASDGLRPARPPLRRAQRRRRRRACCCRARGPRLCMLGGRRARSAADGGRGRADCLAARERRGHRWRRAHRRSFRSRRHKL